jgi:thioredoxin-dependent peroxiredoxin
MKLQEGQPIIHFSTTDIHGNEIDTKSYSGKKLMLSFHRYAECIFCNIRIHHLIKKYKKYHENGLEVITVFQSPLHDIMNHAGRQNPPFTVISDVKRELYKLYKIEEYSLSGYLKGVARLDRVAEGLALGYKIKTGTGSSSLLPADFLINEEGIIEKAFYAEDISEHIPFSEIEDFIGISETTNA